RFIDGAEFSPTLPMPERWPFGDMVSARASVFELVAPGPIFIGARLNASAHIQIDTADIERFIECFPGLPDSLGEGLIALVGTAYLTLGSAGVRPSVTSTNFLYVVANQPEETVYNFTETRYSNDVLVSGSLNLSDTAEIATINVAVEIMALRAGVD